MSESVSEMSESVGKFYCFPTKSYKISQKKLLLQGTIS